MNPKNLQGLGVFVGIWLRLSLQRYLLFEKPIGVLALLVLLLYTVVVSTGTQQFKHMPEGDCLA